MLLLAFALSYLAMAALCLAIAAETFRELCADNPRFAAWFHEGLAAKQHLLAERERMEATLQERDERLRAALWASSTGTLRLDLRTGALEWDENLDQLFGLLPGRTVQTLEDFLALVHPEERDEARRRAFACMREGADFEMDFRVVWPDERVHWLSGKGKTFVDASGRPLYMTGACVDISVQKRQEEEARQRAEFERQILGIVSHDLRNPLSVIRISASTLLARTTLDERWSLVPMDRSECPDMSGATSGHSASRSVDRSTSM